MYDIRYGYTIAIHSSLLAWYEIELKKLSYNTTLAVHL